jgi:hypothetical protein
MVRNKDDNVTVERVNAKDLKGGVSSSLALVAQAPSNLQALTPLLFVWKLVPSGEKGEVKKVAQMKQLTFPVSIPIFLDSSRKSLLSFITLPAFEIEALTSSSSSMLMWSENGSAVVLWSLEGSDLIN